MSAPLGTFSDPDQLIALLRARKAVLHLSNEALEALCGWAGGMSDKYLGPSRTKPLTTTQLAILMEALGLHAVLMIDEAREARMRTRWERQGQRQERGVRDNHRVGRDMVRRARPVVLTELGRKGGSARWAGSTPEARAAHVQKMNAARLAGMTK
jgi:hypothetical protein